MIQKEREREDERGRADSVKEREWPEKALDGARETPALPHAVANVFVLYNCLRIRMPLT